MLEQEAKYFQSIFGDLLKTDLGKFILIKKEKNYGSYDTMMDAIKAGYDKFQEEEFYVKQVLPTQQPLNFINNYLLS